MGVKAAVARAASRRVHVFLIETPGFGLLRMQAQAALNERGWVEAVGPADADALLVCGAPEGRLLELVEAVWAQVPSPRTRALVTTSGTLGSILDSVVVALQDDEQQRNDARTRRLVLDNAPGPTAVDSASLQNEMSHGHEQGATSPEPNMDMGMDADMDIDAAMDMSGPAGIALAGGGQDRDGLEMDVTHLSMGPLLAGWPGDLILHCTLHGDVVADAIAERLPWAASIGQAPEAVRLIDAAVQVLVVAGWDPVAQQLGRLRDEILAGTAPADRLLSRLRRLTARVRRSRTLRWSLTGLRVPGGSLVRGRLLEWLQNASELLEHERRVLPGSVTGIQRAVTADDIGRAVVGQELAATRLIVAGLGIGTASQGVTVDHE